MSKLVNDNIPNILPGYTYRQCKDDKEFFALLKVKLLENVNKLFDQKIIDKKVDSYTDIISDIQNIADVFENVLGVEKFSTMMTDRVKKIGGLTKRFVADIKEVKKEVANNITYDVELVKKFGEDNEYPAMVLVRDGDNVIKTLGKGKENWDNAISWLNLNEPYKSNFLDLVRAVKEKDLYGEEN